MSRPSREDVEQVLADLAAAELDLPLDNDAADAVVTLPVVQHGKLIGRVTQPAGDPRPAMQRFQHRRIRELQRALREGDDPYWIAWVALEVGAGTTLPAVLRHALTNRGAHKGGQAKKGKTKAKPQEIAAFLKKLEHTKGPTLNDRVRKAIVNTALKHTTALRYARNAGFK